MFLHKLVARVSKLLWQSLPKKGETQFLSVVFPPGGSVQFGRTGHLSTKQSNVFLGPLSKSGLNYACRVDRGLQVFLHPVYLPTKTYSYLCMNNVLKSHKNGKRNSDFDEKVGRVVFYINWLRYSF